MFSGCNWLIKESHRITQRRIFQKNCCFLSLIVNGLKSPSYMKTTLVSSIPNCVYKQLCWLIFFQGLHKEIPYFTVQSQECLFFGIVSKHACFPFTINSLENERFQHRNSSQRTRSEQGGKSHKKGKINILSHFLHVSKSQYFSFPFEF